MSKPSAWRSETARSATILCMSARNVARAAAPLDWTAAPASTKAFFNRATGSAAPLTACFSVLSADIAPPISAPNLICTSSAIHHLENKNGAPGAPRKNPAQAGPVKFSGVLLQFDRRKVLLALPGPRVGGAAPFELSGVAEADPAVGH